MLKAENILRILANIISAIFYPMLIPTYAIGLFIIQLHRLAPTPIAYNMLVLGGTLVFTMLIPVSAIMLLKRSIHIKDLYMENRGERLIPYIYSIVSALVWCFFLWRVVKIPISIVYMAISATVCMVVVAVINNWWKISAHLTLWGALTGAVLGYFYIFGIFSVITVLVILLIAWVIMWARLYLNQHTPLQVVTGYILGIIITFLGALI